jgi:hypothetical protein
MSQAAEIFNELDVLRKITEEYKSQIQELATAVKTQSESNIIHRTVLTNDQVSIRTSNCGKGWVLTTRGRNPHIPNFRKIVVNRPDFELVQGVVYLLDEEERNIVSELGKQPDLDAIRFQPKNPKPKMEKNDDQSPVKKTAEIEAEEVLKSLGF